MTTEPLNPVEPLPMELANRQLTSSPTDVSLKEAFDIYQKQSDTIHKLWAYFQIVSFAVLGYTVGTDKTLWQTHTYILIGLSYLFFAIANQWVLIISQVELNRFSTAVQEAANNSGPVGNKLSIKAVAPWKICLFHSISALIVLGALYATWHGKCFNHWSCLKTEVTATKEP